MKENYLNWGTDALRDRLRELESIIRLTRGKQFIVHITAYNTKVEHPAQIEASIDDTLKELLHESAKMESKIIKTILGAKIKNNSL